MRHLLLLVAATIVVSCSAPAPVNRVGYIPNSGPAITGRSEFISYSKLQVTLATARDRLVTLAPSSPIFRVNVVSATRVEIFYCADSDRDSGSPFYQNHPRTGYLLLELRSGQWRILPGHVSRMIEEDHNMIIT